MIGMFGGDTSAFAYKGFAFAATVKFNLEAPLYNQTGVVHRGNTTIGAISNGVTVGELIKISTKNKLNDRHVSLTSSIVNSNIAFDDTVVLSSNNSKVDSEVIDFVIIHKPFVNIDTGANVNYVLSGTVQGNIVFKPNLSSALAYNLNNSNHAEHYNNKYEPQPTPFHPDKIFSWKGLKHAIKSALPLIKTASSIYAPALTPFIEAGS